MNIARTQIDTASVFALKKKLDECGFELDHETMGKFMQKKKERKTKKNNTPVNNGYWLRPSKQKNPLIFLTFTT